MMIKLIQVFCLVISVPVFAQKCDLVKIEVYCASRNIATFSDVSCSRFDSSFSGSKTLFTITNSDTLRLVADRLTNLKYKKKSFPIDVRAKMKIYYLDGTVTEICSSKFNNVVVNGRNVKPNTKLNSLINYYWEISGVDHFKKQK
jgi:hypothetical protein